MVLGPFSGFETIWENALKTRNSVEIPRFPALKTWNFRCFFCLKIRFSKAKFQRKTWKFSIFRLLHWIAWNRKSDSINSLLFIAYALNFRAKTVLRVQITQKVFRHYYFVGKLVMTQNLCRFKSPSSTKFVGILKNPTPRHNGHLCPGVAKIQGNQHIYLLK